MKIYDCNLKSRITHLKRPQGSLDTDHRPRLCWANGRTLLIGASFPWGDAQPWLAEAVPACAPNFPTAKQDPASLPAPANWAMASPGTHTLYDCSKAEALGVAFTSAEDSIKATAVDLAKWGHFKA